MTIYEIEYTNEAEIDINIIVFHIKHKLNNPIAATNTFKGINEKIKNLKYLPERFPVIQTNYFNRENERTTYYKNFSIYYYVDKKKHIVTIDRIVYSKRNLESV